MLDLRKRLNPNDCQLNGGIKIFNAEIDEYLCEDRCEFASHGLGVEFDSMLATWQGVESSVDNCNDLSHDSRLSVARP
jgi:hypothetical protein